MRIITISVEGLVHTMDAAGMAEVEQAVGGQPLIYGAMDHETAMVVGDLITMGEANARATRIIQACGGVGTVRGDAVILGRVKGEVFEVPDRWVRRLDPEGYSQIAHSRAATAGRAQ